MSRKSEVITVRISRQVLWIGAEAYPLRNIARARTIRLIPKHAAAWRHCLIAVVIWVVLGIMAYAALDAAWSDTTSADAHKAISNGRIAVVIVVLVLIAISTIRLIVVLSRPTLYMLVIETAGAQHTALASTKQREVSELVHQIMDAIDDPQAVYQMQVENFHVGDKIQQFGSQNVGKVSR